jgi:Uma2 family endonuclease
MLEYRFPGYLPSAEDLPDSDETPVDNELQELIPGLLKAILLMLWEDRMDWLFAIDMGLYVDPDQPPIVPDAFLSLGVDRCYDEELRPSYVLWDEQVVPSLAIEIVSLTYRNEYTTKLERYAEIGVLYYVVYSSRRRRKPKLEVHKLINGVYQLQSSHPVWMPEIGLGIGYERGNYAGVTREWLYWYDEAGRRYPTPNERVQQESQRAQLEAEHARQEAQRAQQESQRAQQESQRAVIAEQRAAQLSQRLRELGVDPDSLS